MCTNVLQLGRVNNRAIEGAVLPIFSSGSILLLKLLFWRLSGPHLILCCCMSLLLKMLKLSAAWIYVPKLAVVNVLTFPSLSLLPFHFLLSHVFILVEFSVGKCHCHCFVYGSMGGHNVGPFLTSNEVTAEARRAC